MEAYKVRWVDEKEQPVSYYSGRGRWTKKGKTWSSIGHVKNAIHNWQSYRWEKGQPSLLQLQVLRLTGHGEDWMWVSDLLEGSSFLKVTGDSLPHIVITFGSEELMGEFLGWLSDGGGESEASAALGPLTFGYNFEAGRITIERGNPDEDE